MAVQTIYESAVDFPCRIPAICEKNGLVASHDPKRFPRLMERKDSFVYRISDGRSIAHVFGGIDDGKACIWVGEKWGWMPRSRREARELRERIVSLLLQEGAWRLTPEMLMEREDQRNLTTRHSQRR